MKKKMTNFVLIFMVLIGLSLLLYPGISNYWNTLHQSRAISGYLQTVAELDRETIREVLESAREYNRERLRKGGGLALSDGERREYEKQLNIDGNGVMGYLEIPYIDVKLQICHGTTDPVLQTAVGHVEGSSLPVGGTGTHTVLSGHRGLPSAKLFTDLDKLAEGDHFLIHILDETVTYQVDQILIVEPQEIDALKAEEGKDLCTLVTCTPYGVNTHRLLVRGHRVENAEEAPELKVNADAVRIETAVVAPLVAVPIILILLIWLMVRSGKSKKSHRKGEDR